MQEALHRFLLKRMFIVCGMAEKLCEGYRSLCSDILKDDTFWFVLSGDDVEN